MSCPKILKRNEDEIVTYIINDTNLIVEITGEIATKVNEYKKHCENNDLDFSHPLDDDIVGSDGFIKKLILDKSGEIDYSQAQELDSLWAELIKKSIECLRLFDRREPFETLQSSGTTKTPEAYGLDTLTKYHNRYTTFESMLYGASSFYRDHVFHAFRTWMLGVFCLVKALECDPNNPIIVLDGGGQTEFSKTINFFEKISMWTIMALCHDLGYPLEKAEQILDKTREMMKAFVPRPNIWSNFGFNGTQDNINEYIIKFISTKMKPEIDKQNNDKKSQKEVEYLGRIQPKYYLKFAKSLENFEHGIVSSVIVYKMLLYFLESDFNLNDDYHYTQEDARQFYIRREILRAMASHTCADVYNIFFTTFSSLLFLCDEMQQWGRKSWNDMYAGLNSNDIKLEINEFSPSKVDIEEIVDMKGVNSTALLANNMQRIFEQQYSRYKIKFRDGQYTKVSDLSIKKKMILELPTEGATKNEIEINYMLSRDKSEFIADFCQAPSYDKQKVVDEIKEAIKNSLYKSDFISKLSSNEAI